MSDPEIDVLLSEVDTYLARTGMASTTFGRKTVNDGKCVERLRGGGRAWPETVAAIRQFMVDNPPSEASAESPGAAE